MATTIYFEVLKYIFFKIRSHTAYLEYRWIQQICFAGHSMVSFMNHQSDGGLYLHFRDKYMNYYLEHLEIENRPKPVNILAISTVVTCVVIWYMKGLKSTYVVSLPNPFHY